MTDISDKLARMNACGSALKWIGDRTIAQAWSECEHADWMCWLLIRAAPDDPRCRLAAADFAERVWHYLRDGPSRLACAWAIDVARRYARGKAVEDELDAAYSAAADAVYTDAGAAADAAHDAAARAHSSSERRAQANILRGYFSAAEIECLFDEVKV